MVTVSPGATLHFEAAKPWLALPAEHVSIAHCFFTKKGSYIECWCLKHPERGCCLLEDVHMYLGAKLSVTSMQEDYKGTYLVYTVDPKLLERCMSSYLGCQGGYTG